MNADALKDVANILEWIDVEAFACGGDAHQDRSRAAAIVAAKKGPVPPSNRNAAQAALGAVVIDFQVSVITVTDQGILLQ